MNNLDELMKKKVDKKFTKKERKKLIEQAYRQIGKEKYLVICMEEMGELIDVVAKNITGKVDYIHTLEEITDVYYSMDIIKVVMGIPESKIDKLEKKKIKIDKYTALEGISKLARSQQIISKVVRQKDKSKVKTIQALNMLNETLYEFTKMFKIKKKDIEKMKNIKTKRTEERLELGTLS